MKFIFYIVLLFFLLFLLTSCKAGKEIQYVPIESKSVEYIDRLHRDSIHLYDSVYVRETGDTVWLEKYKYIYRGRILRDSVHVIDTISVPYPVINTVEVNNLSLYQKILIYTGLFSIIFFVVYFFIRRK